MSLKFVFWFIIFLWALSVCWRGYNGYSSGANGYYFYAYSGNSLLEFILFCLLGYKAYGKPIDG